MPGWDPCPSPSGEAPGGSFQLLAVLTAPTCIPRLVGLGHLSQKGERIPKVLLQLQSHIMFRGAAEAVSQGAVMALAPLLAGIPGSACPSQDGPWLCRCCGASLLWQGLLGWGLLTLTFRAISKSGPKIMKNEVC